MTATPRQIPTVNSTVLREEWDAQIVDQLREAVAERLTHADADDRRNGRTLGTEAEMARAQAFIYSEIEALAHKRSFEGLQPFSLHGEQRLAAAIFARLYGLGRLQPLLERQDIENIHIFGYDRVAIELADGRVEWSAPVASSDAELVEMIAGFAARMGQTSREFSAANPIVNVRLPAGGRLGARLAAVMEVTPRPHVSIRRHRLVDSTLKVLCQHGTMSSSVEEFLSAAVRAKKNVVITGGPAAGKTTLLRALCNEIPANEHVVTVEDEYELGLHASPDASGLTRLVTAFEARSSNAEGAGEISMHELLKQALRHSPSRVIVGEVRGGEVTAMLQALSNGAAGGMCTIHATSADAIFHRIAALAQLSKPPLPIEAAYQFAATAIDLVVHIVKQNNDQGRQRLVSEIIEVGHIGDSGRPDVTSLFNLSDEGVATPRYLPSQRLLDDLRGVGLDTRCLQSDEQVIQHRPGWCL